MDIVINAALTVVGLVMLCYGGHWLVEGGVGIARKFGISSLIIGMTVVAYGTSTPELAASIVAATGKHTELILGNVVGSNISNIGMVIGISAILVPLVAQKSTVRKEVPIMIGVSLLLVAVSLDSVISQVEGGMLIVGLVAFTFFIYRGIKKQRDENALEQFEKVTKAGYSKALALVGIGIGLLYGGAILTVENAVVIAQSVGLSERIIGITIIAIGTSLPELITSLIAIRRGHHDIGVGNIIGSNIYNILMIIGVSSTIAGIIVVPEIFIDYIVMIAFSLVLLFVMRTGLITRPMGLGVAGAYAAYLGWLFILP